MGRDKHFVVMFVGAAPSPYPHCARSGLMHCSKISLFDHLVGGDLAPVLD